MGRLWEVAVFGSVLVANRGEIARRVLRTCRALGVRTVAVYSDVDAGAPHVREADEAVRLGPAAASESYLRVDRLLAAAKTADVEAIHPGYGFLSENADFAEACAGAGLVFVGPRPETIRLMGDKAAAKRELASAGVPVVPGRSGEGLDAEGLAAAAGEIGLPVLVKAVAGGGGKGMRVVREADALADAVAAARREAAAAFGDDRVLLEKLVERPRHVEVQVLGDAHGGVVHVFERECSVQRRHQKVLEESPSPAVDAGLRERMGAAAVAAARAVGYLGAGTVEFLLGADGAFYFLEMNTRLQVEHPVTELVARVEGGGRGAASLDLVEWQLRVAAGEGLAFDQAQLRQQGHAIEARVYAEDPAADFLPQTGQVSRFAVPAEAGVRVDAGIEEGSTVSRFYDPLLAKLVVHAADRDTAVERLVRLLRTTRLLGVTTNVEFLADVVAHEAFRAGRLTTDFLAEHLPHWRPRPATSELLVGTAVGLLRQAGGHGRARPASDPFSPWATLGPWRTGRVGGWRLRLSTGQGADPVELVVTGQAGRYRVRLGAEEHEVAVTGQRDGALLIQLGDDGHEVPFTLATHDGEVWVHAAGATRRFAVLAATHHRDPGLAASGAAFTSPMPGAVVAVHVEPGAAVAAGATLVVVEAMKMEHPLKAPTPGTVTAVHVTAGDPVDAGTPLVVFEPAESEETP